MNQIFITTKGQGAQVESISMDSSLLRPPLGHRGQRALAWGRDGTLPGEVAPEGGEVGPSEQVCNLSSWGPTGKGNVAPTQTPGLPRRHAARRRALPGAAGAARAAPPCQGRPHICFNLLFLEKQVVQEEQRTMAWFHIKAHAGEARQGT